MADTPYDELVIQRAVRTEIASGVSLIVCTAEDLIIYKMISARLQDNADVEGIIKTRADQLDDAYILNWLRQFEQALDDSTLISTYRRLRGA